MTPRSRIALALALSATAVLTPAAGAAAAPAPTDATVTRTGQWPDYTAPSRPGPLDFGTSAGLTISWAPSTDDRGQVSYEVSESHVLRTTVTDTRYVYSHGPALPPRIYIFAVRAVDPAGNVSPSSYRSLGQIWRGTEVPEAPSGLRVDTPAPGLLRLSWTAPAAPSPFVAPPIAGYEVSLDGRPVGQVGSTSMIIPAPAAGCHTLGVRSLNAVDNLSSVAELAYPVRR